MRDTDCVAAGVVSESDTSATAPVSRRDTSVMVTVLVLVSECGTWPRVVVVGLASGGLARDGPVSDGPVRDGLGTLPMALGTSLCTCCAAREREHDTWPRGPEKARDAW